MNMFDEAAAIKTMLDMRGITRKELSATLGISVSAIANKLRLLSLDESVKAAVTAGKLSERHTRLLLRLKNPEHQLEFINEITDRRLTAAEAEACMELKYLSQSEMAENEKKKKIPCPEEAKDAFIESIKKNIESLSALGVSARLTTSLYGKKSYITIIMEE